MGDTPLAQLKDQQRFQLFVEEYKTLRDEIARFQNQQKQSIIAGFGAILIAVLSGTTKLEHLNLIETPLLLLFGPLLFGPLSVLFFETEISIFRAGYYLGEKLKKPVDALVGGEGLLCWEEFRATDENSGPKSLLHKVAQQPWSKWFFFIWPSILCLLSFVYIQLVLRSHPYSPSVALRWFFRNWRSATPPVILFFVDCVIVAVILAMSRKARWHHHRLDTTVMKPPVKVPLAVSPKTVENQRNPNAGAK